MEQARSTAIDHFEGRLTSKEGNVLHLVKLERDSVLGVQLCFRRFPIDGFSGK